jgi:putative DNA primase/helicase
VLSHILGSYAQKSSIHTFLQHASSSTNGPTPGIVALRGKRFVYASEPGINHHLAEELLKEITGGEAITGRGLYQKEQTFIPQCKLWLSTNIRPRLQADDQAIWDRVKLIPFTQRIGDTREEGWIPFDELVNLLLAEAPGILAWAAEGFRMWQEDGFGPSALTVQQATEEFRHSVDTVQAWLDDCTTTHPPDAKKKARFQELWASWEGWCLMHGEHSLTGWRLGEALGKKQFEKYNDGKGMVYRNLEVKG